MNPHRLIGLLVAGHAVLAFGGVAHAASLPPSDVLEIINPTTGAVMTDINTGLPAMVTIPEVQTAPGEGTGSVSITIQIPDQPLAVTPVVLTDEPPSTATQASDIINPKLIPVGTTLLNIQFIFSSDGDPAPGINCTTTILGTCVQETGQPQDVTATLTLGNSAPPFRVIVQSDITEVPEPGTILLLSSGIAGLAAIGARRPPRSGPGAPRTAWSFPRFERFAPKKRRAQDRTRPSKETSMRTHHLLRLLVGVFGTGLLAPLSAHALPICDPTTTNCGPPSDVFETTDNAGKIGASYTIPETAGATAEGSPLTVGFLVGSSSVSGTVYFTEGTPSSTAQVSDVVSANTVPNSSNTGNDAMFTFESDAETPLSFIDCTVNQCVAETGQLQDITSLFVTSSGFPLHLLIQSDPAEVPEPGTVFLLGSGLAGLATMGTRRRV